MNRLRCYIGLSRQCVQKVAATPAFNQQFDQHGVWRRGFALRLSELSDWLKNHELVNAAVDERLQRLEARLRSDKIVLAFVAEFSRGKSELINALFFADFGRRVMPASAGRTTMCPTEIGYEPGQPTSLRLLPIETRLEPQTVQELRSQPERWVCHELDTRQPVSLVAALEQLSQTRRTSIEEARQLGLWHEDRPRDNPPPDAQGLVEIPRWRHALINIAHPLLRQGLVILDTPGLNAIGAEPELTVNLIPQADAVVFLLGADTGVTQSDLAMWQDHLCASQQPGGARIVVLNKIDTLWDGLNSDAAVQAQLERQRQDVARILAVPLEQIVAVSAQKGLVAKLHGDAGLLAASHLADLETVLGEAVIGRRQSLLRGAIEGAVEALRAEGSRMLLIRHRDLAEQAMELKGLGGKNAAVIRHMKARVENERDEFEQSVSRIHAVKTVHLRMLREVLRLLSGRRLGEELTTLTAMLGQSGLKLGIKKAYAQTFDALRGALDQAQAAGGEIQTMLQASFRQINADFGLALQPPPDLDLGRYKGELDTIEASHLRYVNLGGLLTLARPDSSDRLVRALRSRLRIVFESALSDLELWSKAASSQLDTQMVERRRNFSRRSESIDRIQLAAGDLQQRLSEIEQAQRSIQAQERDLKALCELLTRPANMPDVNLDALTDDLGSGDAPVLLQAA